MDAAERPDALEALMALAGRVLEVTTDHGRLAAPPNERQAPAGDPDVVDNWLELQTEIVKFEQLLLATGVEVAPECQENLDRMYELTDVVVDRAVEQIFDHFLGHTTVSPAIGHLANAQPVGRPRAMVGRERRPGTRRVRRASRGSPSSDDGEPSSSGLVPLRGEVAA